MTPVIELCSVNKTYHSSDEPVHALRSVDLRISRGEFVAILGASGSGKSTCMNILGCLDVPTEGRYLLDGTDVGSMKSDELAQIRNLKLGFVFQSFNLLSRTSALENVALPLMYNRKTSQAEAHERAHEALKAVGLSDRSHHTPAQLSGGQQQRVAVARAIVNEPLIILADEPTGNLDTATSEDIMGLFGKLNDKGITIVLVTHESDIAQFASRNITFRDGVIINDVAVVNRRTAGGAS